MIPAETRSAENTVGSDKIIHEKQSIDSEYSLIVLDMYLFSSYVIKMKILLMLVHQINWIKSNKNIKTELFSRLLEYQFKWNDIDMN